MAIKIQSNRIQPEAVPDTGIIITGQQIQPVGIDPIGQVGAQAGKELKELGALALRVATDLKEQDDKTLAGNAYLDFSNQIRDIENTYYSQRGMNAQGSFKKYREDVDDAFNKTINSIDSSRAQGLFDSISRSRRISSALSMQTYERTQLDKAHLETSNALIEDSTQDAIENFNNPIAIQDARNKIIIGVGQAADMLGWSADQEKVALENAVSKMHVGVIQNMLVNDVLGAKDYMEANIDEIQGTERVALEEKVKRYEVLAEALIRQKNKDDEYAELQARDDAKSEVYKVIMNRDVDIPGKMKAANSLDHGVDRMNALKMVNTIQTRALADIKREVEKESPVNMFNAKEAIDKGLIKNPNQLIEGFFNKVTASDFNFLLGYLNQGGRIGNLKPSIYNSAFKNIFGSPEKNKTAYLGAVKFIRDQIEAGNSPTPENVNQWIIQSATAGEEIEGFHFGDMTYAKAVAEGVDHIWLPKIEDHEENAIVEAIKDYNQANPFDQIEIDEFNKRIWKRVNIMGLPAPDPSIESLF